MTLESEKWLQFTENNFLTQVSVISEDCLIGDLHRILDICSVGNFVPV